VFSTSIALVSLVDSDRQWFKSRQGLDAPETSRDISFCGHAILDDNIMVVNDATQDERFCDNPLVCGNPDIRFYAGYPLAAPDGSRVGTLCVIDEKPREISKEQLRLLRELGRMVEEEMIKASDATTDPATGLSSRKGFLNIADHLLAMCRRCEQPATVQMIHLRNLAAIEAEHGRDESDAAAIELAHMLTANFRNSDIVARICIDIFCVFLSGTDLSGAGPAGVRLDEQLNERNRMDNLPYQLEENVGKKIDKLSREIDKRFDQLTQRLSTEKSERKDAIVTMRGQVREVEKQLKAKLAEADDRVSAEVDEIHGVLGEGHKDLSSLLEKARAELTKSFTSEIAKLERQKTGSKDLAQLFAEMARSLKQDSK
jgi:diguanylate cyclase (GGDEF)-like protein